MLATVYGVNIATINEYIKNIYKDNELEEDSTIMKDKLNAFFTMFTIV